MALHLGPLRAQLGEACSSTPPVQKPLWSSAVKLTFLKATLQLLCANGVEATFQLVMRFIPSKRATPMQDSETRHAPSLEVTNP